MGATTANPVERLLAYASRLRHPQLFLLVLGLLLLNLVLPDPIPLVDEALLGLTALLLGTWRRGAAEPAPRTEKNVTPPEER